MFHFMKKPHYLKERYYDREEGREEGRCAMLSAIRNLMEKMGLSMGQVMDMLGIAKDEQEMLNRLVENKGEQE